MHTSVLLSESVKILAGMGSVPRSAVTATGDGPAAVSALLRCYLLSAALSLPLLLASPDAARSAAEMSGGQAGPGGSPGAPESGQEPDTLSTHGTHDYPVGENEALLVWALETDIEQERVRVKVNRFADPDYRKPFPLESVPVRRFLVYSNPEGRPPGTYADHSTWMVQVAPNGTVADTVLHSSDKSIPATLLASMGAEEQVAFAGMGMDPDAVFDVSLPLDGGPTLVSMRDETVVLNRLGLPPVTHPFNMLLNYPRHSPSVAGIALSRLVVLDEVGAIIREIKEPGTSYSDHYLCPAGRFLTYVASTRETQEVRVLDIETGIEKRVDLPTGPRYYSADGRYTLVRTRGPSPGRAAYYDVSDPYAPILMGEYSTELGILTASVCDDGSLIALLTLLPEGELCSVVLFDLSLAPLGEPLLTSFPVDGGLQFISKFLFVGFQYHPRPAFYNIANSRDILLFDLEFGKEGE